MNLSVSKIVDASLAILNQYGLADMTMRRVAKALDVAPAALYWHVKNKQELLVAIAERIIDTPAPTSDLLAKEITGELSEEAEDLLYYCAHLRAQMLNCRDGAEVVLAALAQPNSELFQRLMGELRRRVAKLTEHADDTVAASLVHQVLGQTLLEQNTLQHAALLREPQPVHITYEIGASSGLYLLVRALERG